MARFLDTGTTIYEFGDTFLVRCPRCDACARVAPPPGQPSDLFGARRCTCGHCGYTSQVPKGSSEDGEVPRGLRLAVGGPFDWYLSLPLWLQTPCCGHTLWAYNERHLNVLAAYISADLRETRSGAGNRSLASRLPDWIKSGYHRPELLRGIRTLRALAPAAGACS